MLKWNQTITVYYTSRRSGSPPLPFFSSSSIRTLFACTIHPRIDADAASHRNLGTTDLSLNTRTLARSLFLQYTTLFLSNIHHTPLSPGACFPSFSEHKPNPPYPPILQKKGARLEHSASDTYGSSFSRSWPCYPLWPDTRTWTFGDRTCRLVGSQQENAYYLIVQRGLRILFYMLSYVHCFSLSWPCFLDISIWSRTLFLSL